MSTLAKLVTTARAIPPTPFRSAGTQLSDAVAAIVSRSFSIQPNSSEDLVNARASKLSASDAAAASSALASVQRINDASALKKYPVSEALTHPNHDPQYYDRMREGVHRSQKGISRSWWKRFFQVRGSA